MAIGTAIEITDKMTGPLNRITAALYSTTDALHDADQATNSAFNSAGIQAITQELYGYERKIQDIQDELDRSNNKIQEMQEQTEKARSSAGGLENAFRKVAGILATVATVQTLKNVLDTSDELTATTARLEMMNNGFESVGGNLKSTSDLFNLVYASAQDARGSFADMSAVVAKFGNNAKDAFSSSAEVVDFANLVQKEMVIAGASTTEASNAMLQLSQALGSGVLRGDELNSIFEQAPNLIQEIADYLEVPIGEIRQMASEGQISADIVKQAIFSASDEINDKFNNMPMTWSQIWTSMQNTALMKFQPVLQRINEIANSEEFKQFTQTAINDMAVLANVSLSVVNTLIQGAAFVSDNWSIISPIIYSVALALAFYNGVLIMHNAYEAVSNGLKLVAAIRAVAHGTATATEAAATTGASAAQIAFNAALYACPLTWIVLAIVAVIAVIYMVVAAINKAQGTTISATGVICGVIATAGALIGNIVIGWINKIITTGVGLWNLIANFAASLGIVFEHPIIAIETMFMSLFNFILSVVESAAKLLDTIFGSSLADAVSGFQDTIQAKIDAKIEDAGGTAANQLNPEDYTLDRINYGDAYQSGYDFGKGIDDKISSVFSGGLSTDSFSDLLTSAGYNSTSDGMASTLGDISKDTSAIADSVDISNENLEYMRDLAEREVINRFTTASVNVNMGGVTNTVSQDTDLDGVISYLANGVTEALQQAAEGVHS